MRIVTSDQMKQIEKAAALSGLSYYDMMENAGAAAVQSILRKINTNQKRILVYTGKGNNGGDGFVAARLLCNAGANVKVILVDGEPRTEDAITNINLVRTLNIEVFDLIKDIDKITVLLQNVDIIVDAIYGTGFLGELRQNAKQAAQQINTAIAAVFALDLPSGINADNGELSEDAVFADFTIAFDSLKPAHFVYPAAEHCGVIECADIGIAPQCHDYIDLSFYHITEEQVFTNIPQRPVNSNKGSFGKLLNISSSFGMTGAGRLSVLGAQRVGTGLVTLAAPRSVIAIHAAALTEAVFLPLSENDKGSISKEAIPQIADKLKEASACLIGCGISNNEDTAAVTEFIIKNAKCPLLIDADGINALCRNINVLYEAKAPVVLTPHPAEMARLLGISTAQLLVRKVELGREFAVKYRVVLVLKGANTLIFTPDGTTLVNTTGNSGLAKGGSGDILAGMIAGFMAQGIPAEQSAECGVYLHGKAADLCAARLSKTSMMPSELLEDLCILFLEHGR